MKLYLYEIQQSFKTFDMGFFLKNGQLCNTRVTKVTQCNIITYYRCILHPACPNKAKFYTAANLPQNDPTTSNDPIDPNDLTA